MRKREVYGHGSGAGSVPLSNDSGSERAKTSGLKNLKLKKLAAEQKLIFSYFSSKTAIYLSLGLHKGRTSYKRSLQPSKENTQQHFKT
jgi:hypothetical protein